MISPGFLCFFPFKDFFNSICSYHLFVYSSTVNTRILKTRIEKCRLAGILVLSLCSKTFLGCLIGSYINMYILTMLGQYKSLVSPMKRGIILFSSHRKGLCLYLTPGSIFLFLPLSLQQPNDREDQNPYKILLSGWTFKLRYTFDSEHLLIFYKVSGSKNQPLY